MAKLLARENLELVRFAPKDQHELGNILVTAEKTVATDGCIMAEVALPNHSTTADFPDTGNKLRERVSSEPRIYSRRVISFRS